MERRLRDNLRTKARRLLAELAEASAAAELAGPSHCDDDAGGLATRPVAWAPDDGVLAPSPSPFASGEARLLRQAEGVAQLHPAACHSCGCTDVAPCPGGCMWANAEATLCSRCALGGGSYE